jgi:hypothetical protein
MIEIKKLTRFWGKIGRTAAENMANAPRGMNIDYTKKKQGKPQQ